MNLTEVIETKETHYTLTFNNKEISMLIDALKRYDSGRGYKLVNGMVPNAYVTRLERMLETGVL